MDGSSCCADAVTEPFPKPRGLPRRAEERLPSVEETPVKETVGSTPHNHCIHPSSLHNQQPAPREGFRSSLQEESVSTGGPEAAKAGDDSVKVLEAEPQVCPLEASTGLHLLCQASRPFLEEPVCCLHQRGLAQAQSMFLATPGMRTRIGRDKGPQLSTARLLTSTTHDRNHVGVRLTWFDSALLISLMNPPRVLRHYHKSINFLLRANCYRRS